MDPVEARLMGRPESVVEAVSPIIFLGGDLVLVLNSDQTDNHST